MKSALILALGLLTISTSLFSQQYKGQIIDANNNERLAYVNIIYNKQKDGCATDANGYFIIEDSNKIEFLQLSLLGYEKRHINNIEQNKNHIFKLKQTKTQLSEVEILPGENPAHRFIDSLYIGMKNCNPNTLDSYTYIDYSKCIIKLNTDSLKQFLIEKDSIDIELDSSNSASMVKFSEQQYLFFSENVSAIKYKKPNNKTTEVLANRVSGMQNPQFALLSDQLFGVEIFEDDIYIAGEKYISPLCKGSTKRYFFLLQDTLTNNQGDSIFIIDFQPKRKSNFKGLKGSIKINSNGWYVEELICESNILDNEEFSTFLHHKLKLIDNKYLFAYRKKAGIKFITRNSDSLSNEPPVDLIFTCDSYYKDIKTNVKIDKSFKTGYQTIYKEEANNIDSTFWSNYREDSLSNKEKCTYVKIDSIGKEYKLDQKLAALEILASNKVQIKYINIDLSKNIFNYNKHENLRLGLAIETSSRVSKLFSANTYAVYGFGDKKWKYSFGGKYIPFKNNRLDFNISYTSDIFEADNYTFKRNKLSTEAFRNYFIESFNSYKIISASFNSNPIKGLYINGYFNHNQISDIGTYQREDEQSSISEIQEFVASISIRAKLGERIIRTPKGNHYSLGSKYPDIQVTIEKGLNYKEFQDQNFWRIYGRFYDKIESNWYGNLHLTADAGILLADKHLFTKEFAIHSLGCSDYLDGDNYFNTMAPREFITDKFLSVFLKYEITTPLYKTSFSKPELSLVTNFLIGDRNRNISNENIFNTTTKTPTKGYYESGIQITNLYNSGMIGMGVSFYYRYGEYALDSFKNNFAAKLNLRFNLDF